MKLLINPRHIRNDGLSTSLGKVYYFILIVCLTACSIDNHRDDESVPLSPKEELATFQIESRLKIELVAAEPLIEAPVATSFDEDGRLWVVEMCGYMSDIDGSHEKERIGRVSILEDKDGDGQMDKSTIYLDSLILPRALAVVAGGALIAENESLWLTQDLDGDLKADTKILIDSTYAGSAMPEHSGNGLWRGVDNWYYNAKSRLRYRFFNNIWKRDSTEFRGQWGISHDDQGRLFYNYNWSQLHADLVAPNYLSRNKNHSPTTGIDHGLTIDRRIYPIRSNPAVNRGYIPGTLDDQRRLLEFTSACSPFVFRGNSLPIEFYGNVFVCETAGNLVKRNVVEQDGLLLSAHDPNPGKEFMASTDERFRPVALASGPDGSLYVIDMYRGLIQHGAYVTPYLREQSISRKLDQSVNNGRIWRISSEKKKATKPIKLSDATTDELIGFLSSNNGWQRDMAQRLLVERNDKTVEEALTKLALTGANDLGRFHALWTLEGLQLLKPEVLFQLLWNKNAVLGTTALRLSEPFIKENTAFRVRLEKELIKNFEHAPIEQAVQIAFTSQLLNPEISYQLLKQIAEKYGSSSLLRDAILSSLENHEYAFLKLLWNSEGWQEADPSKEIFIEMLTTSIIRKANPNELESLLTMLDSDKLPLGWKENAVVNGLYIKASSNTQPVRLKKRPAILANKNKTIEAHKLAAIASHFEWPGHETEKDLSKKVNLLSDADRAQFAIGRQHYLTSCSGCHGANGAGIKRFAPPLINSDWVLGDEKRLSLILLHGLEGPIQVNGIMYDAPEILPVMPAHSTMPDASISAILTYIRNEWGNTAGAVSGRVVSTTRHTSQGRVIPWTAKELDQHMIELKEKDEKLTK